MTKEVAILNVFEIDGEYTTKYIPFHISEWTKVTDEEFKRLRLGINLLPRDYDTRPILIERPIDQAGWVTKALEAEAEHQRQVKEAQAKREAQKRKAKKTAKKSKEELYEQLKKELGK